MATNIEKLIAEKVKDLPEDAQQKALTMIEELEKKSTPEGERPVAMSLWEKIEALARQVPEEVLEKLPTDGSHNIDHYLYGAPKKA